MGRRADGCNGRLAPDASGSGGDEQQAGRFDSWGGGCDYDYDYDFGNGAGSGAGGVDADGADHEARGPLLGLG